jgi:uncharacterized membrane protein
MKLRLNLFPASSVALAALMLSCTEMPLPPTASTDPELIAAGLVRDSLGIWRDPELGNRPFSDMPVAYQEFWRYCFSCHSSSGKNSRAREARRALKIDTWREVLRYGPEKLILSVKTGGMPLPSSAPVPEEVLSRVQAFIATWGDTAQRIDLIGFRYKEAEQFNRKFCADCHAPGGRHLKQPSASRYILLDTYASWQKQQVIILPWIDPELSAPMAPPMPPEDYPNHPDSLERARIVDWLNRRAPNTADGSGLGAAPTPPGSMRGLVYDTARTLVNRYCADCHTEGGYNSGQWDGWAAVQFDTYAQWKNFDAAILIRRMNPDSALALDVGVMPPGTFPHQPSPEERSVLMEWLKRGSPNTAGGQ